MPVANRKRIEALLRDARIAAGRNQNPETRTALQAARGLLALEEDPIWVGERVRAIHAIENQLRSPARAKARQNGTPAPTTSGKPKPRRTSSTALLRQRVAQVEALIQSGRAREAKKELILLQVRLEALADGSASHELRNRVSKLERQLGQLQRTETVASRPAPVPGNRSSKPKKVAGAGKPKTPAKVRVEQVTCDLCKRRRPPDQIIKKAGKRQICVPCATGQTCPSCHRSKSPDFELCIRCSGGAGQIKLVLAGGFETNRRRH